MQNVQYNSVLHINAVIWEFWYFTHMWKTLA